MPAVERTPYRRRSALWRPGDIRLAGQLGMEPIRRDIESPRPRRCTRGGVDAHRRELGGIVVPPREHASPGDVREIGLAFDTVLEAHPQLVAGRASAATTWYRISISQDAAMKP